MRGEARMILIGVWVVADLALPVVLGALIRERWIRIILAIPLAVIPWLVGTAWSTAFVEGEGHLGACCGGVIFWPLVTFALTECGATLQRDR